LLVQTVGASLTPLLQNALAGQTDSPGNLTGLLCEAIKTANRAIFQKAQADANLRGMGSTVAVVLVWNGRVTIGHVGDCRVYHQGPDKLTQVTRDQTLVARMVELGQLSPQEAETHPSRNEVLQAVGRHPDVTPAGYEATLKPGEWLIVACDGLHAHVDHVALENTVWSATSAVQVAERLVELANEGGGTDNCTVVAVRCY
jgi:protein phosphatase